MAFSVGRRTRLSGAGHPRSLHASFSGKTEAEIAAVITKGGVNTRETAAQIRKRNLRLFKQIQRDDDEVLALYIALHG